jgi:hypothetical protein
MGRTYDVPDALDEENLMAELQGLEDEVWLVSSDAALPRRCAHAQIATEETEETPSYLTKAAAAPKRVERAAQPEEQFDLDAELEAIKDPRVAVVQPR